MRLGLVLLLICIFYLIDSGHCLKKFPHDFKFDHKNQIKIVTYAIKSGAEENALKLSKVPVRNLEINGFKDWIAKAVWNGDAYNVTGWSFLEIETNEAAKDFDQAFAAGVLEGHVTKDLISLHLLNTVGDFCKDDSLQCHKLTSFLVNNFKWIHEKIEQHPDDPYWHQVNLVFAQFFGLYHGYYGLEAVDYQREHVLKLMVKDIKPFLNLIALQLNGDMSELLASLTGLSNPFIAGSCSALIKILSNNSDIFVAHDTWGPYEVMLKVMKHFKLNYHLNQNAPQVVPGSEVSFSSYPGILVSVDDFYVLKSGLVVTETTIGNSNTDLWKYVTTSTILYWIRNMVANRLSYTGSDWAKWFSLHNSGTYNNEWMVIDMKRFQPGEPLKDGLFTVLEQTPGQTMWKDKTDTLRAQSYWPSYNLAYYPEIYNISGTFDAFVKYGSFFSYDESPRASIFRRDQSSVTDIHSMMNLMRSNNYTNDPLSRCDCSPPYSGENAISARSDLNPASGTYAFEALGHRDHGATDMKLTTWKMVQNLDFIGIAGPTYNENVAPFAWSQADFGNSTNHFGHPDKWTFKPVYTKWIL